MRQGLCLPASLGRQAAVKIASAYADEQFKAYRADAEAAERRYQQQLLATQASKMHVLKLRRKLDQIARDASWFHLQAAGITSIEDPDWNAPSALLPTYYASSYDSGKSQFPHKPSPLANVDIFRRHRGTWQRQRSLVRSMLRIYQVLK
jgi:hypothetical protein